LSVRKLLHEAQNPSPAVSTTLPNKTHISIHVADFMSFISLWKDP